MGASAHILGLRRAVGHDLLLLPAVAALIRDGAGALLCQRRSDNGLWGLPGGAVDPGEEPARALVRETFEETGLLVRPAALVAVLGGTGFRHCYPNGDVAEYMIALFECRVVRGVLGGSDGESLELCYFPTDALPELFAPFPEALLNAPTAQGAAFAWDEGWLELNRTDALERPL